ncbi:MAG TPA: outer membrane beta-barrel protein [Thermoanaerobaculia bacterium]|nr:outer membrane beta-barrel protein [Thermoanaerobaculia bacterium]
MKNFEAKPGACCKEARLPLARIARAGIGTFAVVLAILASPAPAGAQTCPAGAIAGPKSSSLYLFFPTSADATFPSYGGEPTSPVNPFDMAQHDASLDTAAVRNRTFQLMQVAFCEFDVGIKLVTTPPSPPEARWQIVGIGSDTSNGPIGKAQAVDTGDADAQDYCRVWVEELESWTGAELSGANSTVERWATAIANLSAHEGGHNYGGMHSESAPRPGEDARPNHFMADPAAGATPDTISDRLNHFSDTTYERFGHDLGLNIKTLHNWDFVNPNGSSADRLTITLLSSATTLTIGWSYNGSLSPWTNPTVTKRTGTITFRGTAYNVFDLAFSSPKAWSGGPNGVAPAGEKFHVGASFTQPDPVIVYETALASGGTELALKPRIFGYDAGTSSFGEFAVSFFNTGGSELILSDVQVLFLPRMLDIEQMVAGGELLGIFGNPITPFQRQPGREEDDGIVGGLRQSVRVGREPVVLPVAKLTDRRHLDLVIEEGYCEPGSGPGFGDPRVVYCPTPGNVLSLFPATYTYVIASVTEPNARFWDRTLGRLVDGPLTNRIFFQIGGEVPDANHNGLDDLIDIREGTSRDDNENGIPDEAERGGHRLAVFAGIGVASPEGSASNAFDSGPSLAVGLEYELRPRLSLLATLGFDELSDDGAGTDLEVRHLTFGGRVTFLPGAALVPFAQAGVGAYDLSPGDTDVGAHAGVGVRRDLTPRLSLELVYDRHRVESDPDSLEMSTAQVRLRLRL